MSTTTSDKFDKWNNYWKEKKTGWDQGQPAPALVSLLETDLIPKKGRVLVPGCGSGYDVFLFASRGNDAYGLDISPLAGDKGRELLSQTNLDKEKVHFITGNFFEFPFEEAFDLVYDYTFFCAIDLDMREAWGKRMGELVRKDGLLITLMFPIGTHTTGPPFAVQPEHYQNVLKDFERILIKDVEHSLKDRQGREKIVIWKRK